MRERQYIRVTDDNGDRVVLYTDGPELGSWQANEPGFERALCLAGFKCSECQPQDVFYEHQAGELPIRLSFGIRVF